MRVFCMSKRTFFQRKNPKCVKISKVQSLIRVKSSFRGLKRNPSCNLLPPSEIRVCGTCAHVLEVRVRVRAGVRVRVRVVVPFLHVQNRCGFSDNGFGKGIVWTAQIQNFKIQAHRSKVPKFLNFFSPKSRRVSPPRSPQTQSSLLNLQLQSIHHHTTSRKSKTRQTKRPCLSHVQGHILLSNVFRVFQITSSRFANGQEKRSKKKQNRPPKTHTRNTTL